MNRADFQALANLHLRHGEALLKAAVAKLFRYTADFEFPGSEKRGAGRGGLDLYSHDLPFLVKVAGLSLPWADELEADGVLKDNWNIAKNWTPESRYQLTRGAQEAQDYYSAVADTNSGVVKCIERFW